MRAPSADQPACMVVLKHRTWCFDYGIPLPVGPSVPVSLNVLVRCLWVGKPCQHGKKPKRL